MRGATDVLIDLGTATAAGGALFTTLAVIAATILRDLGRREVELGEWAAYGAGFGGLFGIAT